MILDDLSITEFSRLLKRSRPTVYKYITEYKRKKFDNVPNSVKELFDRVTAGCTMSEVYAYCKNNFSEKEVENEELKQIINLITANADKINLEKLKKYIKGEIENGTKADS